MARQTAKAPPSMNEEGQKFDDTPKGWQARWTFEMNASKEEMATWHEMGEQVVRRFTDDRPPEGVSDPRDNQIRWNIFPANVQMQRDLVFGKVPQASVERRFTDANDSVGRIAGQLLERLLNTDILRDSDTFNAAAWNALTDYQLPGLGVVKLRYKANFTKKPGKQSVMNEVTGKEIAPATEDTLVKSEEDVETDYVYWKDQRWSPSRTFQDFRWWAFRTLMTEEEGTARFGSKFKSVPMNAKKAKASNELDASKKDPRKQSEVWEVWDKEHQEIFWVVEGAAEILDRKKDLYKLPGFWPCPEPLAANLTTSKFLPTPFFVLAKDLYDEVDSVSTRITLIQRVIRVCGGYDRSAGPEVGRLVKEAGPNELIPIDNWPKFSEKGGFKGLIDWLPIEALVAALDKLRDYRSEVVAMLFQLTGYSDLMRGQQVDNGTPGEASVKARFASIRLQAAQERFAKFISDALRIKAYLIVRFFSDKTIIERSSALYTFDAQDMTKIYQAIQLLRSRLWMYRIEVKPENVAQADFAALKDERVELMTSLSQFFLAMAPMAQAIPGSTPLLLQLLQWTLAGLRGGSKVGGLIDAAVQQFQQAQQQAAAQAAVSPPPPDPKVMAIQVKAQAEQQKQMLQAQIDSAHIEHETQAMMEREEHSAALDVAKNTVAHKLKAALPQASVTPKGP